MPDRDSPEYWDDYYRRLWKVPPDYGGRQVLEYPLMRAQDYGPDWAAQLGEEIPTISAAPLAVPMRVVVPPTRGCSFDSLRTVTQWWGVDFDIPDSLHPRFRCNLAREPSYDPEHRWNWLRRTLDAVRLMTIDAPTVACWAQVTTPGKGEEGGEHDWKHYRPQQGLLMIWNLSSGGRRLRFAPPEAYTWRTDNRGSSTRRARFEFDGNMLSATTPRRSGVTDAMGAPQIWFFAPRFSLTPEPDTPAT